MLERELVRIGADGVRLVWRGNGVYDVTDGVMRMRLDRSQLRRALFSTRSGAGAAALWGILSCIA